MNIANPNTTTTETVAPDPYVYQYLPACSGNNPNGGGDSDCTLTRTACPPGQLLFFLWQAPATDGAATGPYTQSGRQCLAQAPPAAPGAAPEEPVLLPGMTEADFQRLPLPAGTSTVQPASGEVLINMPTNAYASAEPVTLDTDLLGFPVTVRATPVAYSWDYGDGTALGPVDDPGAPYPDLGNAHTYTEPGSYAITLTTHYEGEYSILDGPWLPVPGQAEISSDPQEVVTHQGGNVLVADALD